MKYLSLFLFAFLTLIACQSPTPTPENSSSTKEAITSSPLPKVDTSLYETFTIQEGDTTFLMKKYFMVHLKKGTNRDQAEKEAAKIQEAHLAHLGKLAEDKKLCIAGPFDAAGTDILGIAIYSVPNLEIADSLANADPAVKAGRLSVDVFPFWAAVGSQLF